MNLDYTCLPSIGLQFLTCFLAFFRVCIGMHAYAASIKGSGTATPSQGVVTFVDVALDANGVGFGLLATSQGLTPGTYEPP